MGARARTRGCPASRRRTAGSPKPEGAAVTSDGRTFVVADDDAVDGWSGETWFLSLGRCWRWFQDVDQHVYTASRRSSYQPVRLEVSGTGMHDDLIGRSAAIEELRREILVAARSDAKVLITGESGAGKEIVARSLWRQSTRADRTMLPINCAGIPESLLESALFGHVRGSFTGAVDDRRGLLESAQRGTVFLDEIGEMTPRMQGLLLRFVQSGEIQRVGDTGAVSRVDVRIIAATQRDLRESVARGEFRLDLFYRLNVIHLRVPPLRARMVDMPILFERFITRYCRHYEVPPPRLEPEALQVLNRHHWPGNVRELQNVAERLVVSHEGEVVDGPCIARLISGCWGSTARDAPCADHAETLFDRIVMSGESFWSAAHAPFIARDMTREELTELIRLGLMRSDRDYKRLAQRLNIPDGEDRRFIAFLKSYRCYVPVRDLEASA